MIHQLQRPIVYKTLCTHFDRQREQVNLFQRGDFTILDQTTELSYRHPFLLGLLASATATAATASSATGTSPAESTTEITTTLGHLTAKTRRHDVTRLYAAGTDTITTRHRGRSVQMRLLKDGRAGAQLKTPSIDTYL